MKTRDQFLTGLAGFNLLLAGTALYNTTVKKDAVSGNLLVNRNTQIYPFKLGNIRYTKCGTGPALLLLHDLDPASCGEDWAYVLSALSLEHTVYVPDLLGCGASDKPNIIYTSYVYVELLADFIHAVIGEKTSVIASGNSASLLLMAVRMHPDLIDRMILISPEPVSSTMLTPKGEERFLLRFIHLPVFGTLLYNIFTDKRHIAGQLRGGIFQILTSCRIGFFSSDTRPAI